jgi:hypothetical protein
MSHDDFEFEPIRGLPALLPEGEKLLWQGAPCWKSLAIRAYHVRKVAVYFALLVVWRILLGLNEGHTAGAILLSCLFLLALGAAAIGVLALLAYLNARSTVYSITSRRVLLRHGVAVPLTMNVPLRLIDNAALKYFADGTGDISLALPRHERMGYMIGWPHVRPGKFTRPEPSLRGLADARAAAEILGSALAAESGTKPAHIAAGPRETALEPRETVMGLREKALGPREAAGPREKAFPVESGPSAAAAASS